MSSKLTKKEIQKDFIALINSCVEGYTEEWTPSCGESREGFLAMKDLLENLAGHFKVDISKAKKNIKEFKMAIERRTRGGQGGKIGHSNMSHYTETEIIKKGHKKHLRKESKKIICEELT